MVKHRLHLMLRKGAGGLLLFLPLGLCAGARLGRAIQLQGETLRNRAQTAAAAASSAAKSSGATSPIPVANKKPQQKTGKRAPGEMPFIPTPAKRPVLVGLRDPFKLPPPPGPGNEAPVGAEELRGPLPPGARGLVINQLRLEGVVRLDQSNTMIAVVTNYTNRAYFLRENDAVYNGVVSKITPDSIGFRENYLDQYGRAQVREVVRRLSGAPGEGR